MPNGSLPNSTPSGSSWNNHAFSHNCPTPPDGVNDESVFVPDTSGQDAVARFFSGIVNVPIGYLSLLAISLLAILLAENHHVVRFASAGQAGRRQCEDHCGHGKGGKAGQQQAKVGGRHDISG
jgi:hypothetical protein